ncbi:dihydrofolate reductase [candidate division KSB1 bacterium]|nr:dihydrofolate reductase [candidate division KSB1 bacterium]RQW04287.1 MAG: dihydrofolate reductase [candidate division KSB1 bacterium]
MKIIIAAMGSNRVIGAGDKLPWWVPEEYQLFLHFITAQTVIMGRKTFDIFSKDLPSKRNLVISLKKKSYARATIFSSVYKALDEAERYPEDIYIAGGATIYRQTIDLVDKLYLSIIKGDFTGDAFFPPFQESNWVVEQRSEFPAFEFIIYAKKL